MRKDIISHIHRDLRLAQLSRRGATKNLADAVRNTHKKYPRMVQIHLPETDIPSMSLAAAIQQRHSFSEKTYKTLSIEKLGGLLSGIRTQKRDTNRTQRTYPSGGSLYPIETYFVGCIDGEPATVFHYNPSDHALEKMWHMPEHLNLFDIFGNSFEDTGLRTCGALIFTAVWERTASKYGDFSYILSLLEAGHMAQNILLIATALGVCARPIGGFNDAAVKETLDIDNWEEQTVYTVALF